jgi:hypothetical protein
MKNIILALSFLTATLYVFGCEVQAAEATATATIAPVISGTKNTETPTGGDLVFGIIIPSESSGTVTIIPLTSTRSYSGGVQLVSSVYGAASFNVTGAANSAYTVTLPKNDAITISNGSSTMVVNSFTVSPAANTLKLNNEGLSAFNIGGKLEVSANQPPGNYTGAFEVTIAYQ